MNTLCNENRVSSSDSKGMPSVKVRKLCRCITSGIGMFVISLLGSCMFTGGSTGRVELMLGSRTARTILPTVTVASYRISFSGPVDKDPVSTTDANPTIALEVGTWDISVEGRDSDGDTVAVGSANDVVVTPGDTTPVSIMLYAQSSGSGTIDVTVEWPASEIVDLVEVTLDGSAVDVSTLTSGDTWVRYLEEDMPADSSILCFKLYKNGVPTPLACVQEAVQVYMNLTSSATITLTLSDFSHPPAAPSGLSVSEGLEKLVLHWTDNSSVEIGYTIERGTNGITYGAIDSISAPATSYDDTTAAMGQTYFYRVKATNDFGASDPSGSASGKVEAPIPGGAGVLTFGAVTSSSIRVNWQKATDNVSAQTALTYKVVRSLSNNVQTVEDAEVNGTVVRDWTADIATADATGLSAGTAYYFNVLVRDEAGNTSIYLSNSQMTLDGTGSISITITVISPQNETITFDRADDIVMTPGSTLQVTISESFDTYGWMLDGSILVGQISATASVDCTPLALGVHHLTTFVEKDGHLYSETLRFRVEN
jgi:hypothetical protein